MRLPVRLALLLTLFPLGAQAQGVSEAPVTTVLSPPVHIGVTELKAAPVAQLGVKTTPLPLPRDWEWTVPEASIPLNWQDEIIKADWISPLIRPLLISTALRDARIPERWSEAETGRFFGNRLAMLWRGHAFAEAEALLQAVPPARHTAEWDRWHAHNQLLQGKVEGYCTSLLAAEMEKPSPEDQQLRLACQASQGEFGEALLSLEVMRAQGKSAPAWLNKYVMELAQEGSGAAFDWPKQMPLPIVQLTKTLPNAQLPASVWQSWADQPDVWPSLVDHPSLPVETRLNWLEALATESLEGLTVLQQAYAGIAPADDASASPAVRRAMFWQQWSRLGHGVESMKALEEARPLFADRPLLWLATYGRALATRANTLTPKQLSERQQAMVILSLLANNQHYLASSWMQSTGRSNWLDQLDWLEEGLGKVTRKQGVNPLQRQIELYASSQSWPELSTLFLAKSSARTVLPEGDWTVAAQGLMALGQEDMAESWQRQQFVNSELQRVLAP